MTIPQITLPEAPDALKFDVPRMLSPDFQISSRGETGLIKIFAVIGLDVTPTAIAAALRSFRDVPITIEVNSPGGDYYDGVAIYNMFRNHPKPVTARVLGLAGSAASLIIMGADTIEIAHNAEIMIHNPWTVVKGNSHDLEDAAKWMRRLNEASIDVYATRTGNTRTKVAELLDNETFMNATTALELGFADTLIDRDAVPRPAVAAHAKPQNKRELENQLRDFGFSRAAAAKIAGGGWTALSKENPANDEDLASIAMRLNAHSAEISKL